LLTVNTGLVNPAASGTATAVIALNYTHTFPQGKPGDLITVSAGKFDVLDLVSDTFLGGEGLVRFMNVAWNSRPQNGVNIPPVAIGSRFVWIRDGGPVITFAVYDPQSRQMTSGLDDPFGKGVTLAPGITFQTRYRGRVGHQGFSGTWSSQK